ncbi:MAG: helix-turn-helix domain-containing protein, partial [Lacisediminimonas sp.]|nr:helix-turn-helix domain-containing protein [Lacisediminimonas sp.]
QRILREVLARDARAAVVGTALPDAPASSASSAFRLDAAGADYQEATTRFQRDLIERALAAAQGNLGRAATALGLTRHALRHQMIKLGLVTQDGDGAEPLPPGA